MILSFAGYRPFDVLPSRANPGGLIEAEDPTRLRVAGDHVVGTRLGEIVGWLDACVRFALEDVERPGVFLAFWGAVPCLFARGATKGGFCTEMNAPEKLARVSSGVVAIR